jgi:hypothetical protein
VDAAWFVLLLVAVFAGTVFLVVNVISWRFAGMYWRRPGAAPAPTGRRIAVMLSVRGHDVSLERCVRGLLEQDYPDFDLHICVDHPDDPSDSIIADVLAEWPLALPRVHVSHLRNPYTTCSLKMSAHLQSLQEIGDFDFAAFVDADVDPPRNWLRTLVAPFSDPKVVATSGVRWYAPRDHQWGSLIRSLWNAGSQPFMQTFGLAWGGTSAVRMSLFQDPRDRQFLRRCFYDDSGIANLIHRANGRIHWLPELTIINQESIALPNCVAFLTRQLLGPFVDLPNRRLLVAFTASILVALAASIFAVVGTAASGMWSWCGVFAALLTLNFVSQLTALVLVEPRIRRIVVERGQLAPPFVRSWRMLVAPFLAQVVQGYCFAGAVLARTVQWRGIVYRISGHQRIVLDRYVPVGSRIPSGS